VLCREPVHALCERGRQSAALAFLKEVFELRPHFEWRGLGFIPESALKLRRKFAQWDAELRFEVPGVRVADPKACQCGEVLKGAIKPWECKVFGTACTPETPIGTAWSPRKEPVPPITTSDACTEKWPSTWAAPVSPPIWTCQSGGVPSAAMAA